MFRFLQEDGREESPRSDKSTESNRKAAKSSSPKEPEHKGKDVKNKMPSTESEDSAKVRAVQKDSRKNEQLEANEAKMIDSPPVNGDAAPASAKSKTSSVNSNSSSSGKNKLQEEKRDSSVKISAEKKDDISKVDSPKAVSPVPEHSTKLKKENSTKTQVGDEVEILAEQTAASVVNNEKEMEGGLLRDDQVGSGVITEPDEFDHLVKAAEDLMATWIAEEDEKSNRQAAVESGGVPMNHEDAKKWFYKDPQGDLQGGNNTLLFQLTELKIIYSFTFEILPK